MKCLCYTQSCICIVLKLLTHYVSVSVNSKSETRHSTNGVPQWPILGPLIFIIYVNDFPRAADSFFFFFLYIKGHTLNGVIE